MHRRAVKLAIFILTIAIILLFTEAATIEAASEAWQPLPLRTQAQKDEGMAGGEGMQMGFGISYAPSNPDIAYFVSDTSQVWKSIDGGYSWESMPNGFRSNGGISLAVDPLNEDVVFVSGSLHNPSNNTSPVDGIYRTDDGGASWQLVKQTAYYRNKEGQHFVFDPRSFDSVSSRHMTIYAGTHEDGLFKSEDGGDSWTVVGLDGTGVGDGTWISDIEINIDNSNNTAVLYIATKQGLKKGIDNDSSVSITSLGNLPVYPRTIALNPQSNPANDIIYAALGTSKVYKSVNGGQNFVLKSSGLYVDKNYMIIDISKADYNYLYVSVDNYSGHNPFYSQNGGETWSEPTDIDEGYSITEGVALASVTGPHPTDANIALHNFAGRSRISKTTNGGVTWKYSGNGYMGARRVYKTSTYFDPVTPDRKIFFLVDFGPAVTENNGDTWELLPVPWHAPEESNPYIGGESTPVGAVDPNDQNIIVAPIGKINLQDLAISTDGGQNWSFANNTTGDFKFISFHPQDSTYVYAGTYNSGWISSDSGSTWTSTGSRSIRAVFPGNGDFYAFQDCTGFNNPVTGCDTNKSILWRSYNDGTDWTQVSINPFTLQSLHDLDIDPLDGNRLYAACFNDFYVYDGSIAANSDQTIRWSATGKSGGIPTENFETENFEEVYIFAANAVAVDPTNTNTVYAGLRAPGKGHRQRYIYRSVDYGQTWQDIGSDLLTSGILK